MKFFSVLMLVVAVFAATDLAHAQTSSAIAVVDLQKILRDSKAGQSIRKQMEEKQEAFQGELRKQDEKLKSAREELAKQRSILSQSAFAERREKFEKDIGKTQQSLQGRKQELEKSFAAAMDNLQKEIVNIVQAMARDNEYALVLPRSQVVLVQNNMDITDTVLATLDKKVKNIKVR